MKKCTIIAAFLVSTSLQAQKLKESEVPQRVKTAFAKSFPDVKSVAWSKESEAEFEAEFKNGKLEQSANFDAAGKWLVTETEINKSELPAAVQASITKEFAGYKITEAEKVEKPDQVMSYEIQVEKGKSKYNIDISPDGSILKKAEAKEDDKD